MAPISWEAPLQATSKAQRSTSADVTDTFEFFGQKECVLKNKSQKGLDERNLGACTTLKLMGSGYEALDTRYLRSVETLDISGTKIRTLNTAPLGLLRRLELSFTPIAELNTYFMPELRVLSISFTKITALDLEPLKHLYALYTISAPCKYYDLRHTPCLRSLMVSFGVKYLDLAGCPQLDTLSVSKSKVAHIKLAKDVKIKDFDVKKASLRFLNARKRYNIEQIDQDETQIVFSSYAPLSGMLAVQPPPALVYPPPQVQPLPPQQMQPQVPPQGYFDYILPPSFM